MKRRHLIRNFFSFVIYSTGSSISDTKNPYNNGDEIIYGLSDEKFKNSGGLVN